MWTVFELSGALLLFLIGLRLSAFFSGSETGFYRLSFLRLSIDAHEGDSTASGLLWFVQNPAYFVATTLVGNNVANYVTTLSLGVTAVALEHAESGWVEIVGTLLISPVVFVFGELVPKNLYYRAPMHLMRRDARWFKLFYWAFLPASFPLIAITRLFERLSRSREKTMQLVLGRSRLVQVLSQGHREGLLTDVQNRLVDGLLHTAAQPVTDSVIPDSRVLGMEDDTSCQKLLEFGRSFGVSHVIIRKAGTANSWYGYVRVIDAAIGNRPLTSIIQHMPVVPADKTKLEAMMQLRDASRSYGLVRRGDQVLGVVSDRGLVEQLFRRPPGMGKTLPIS